MATLRIWHGRELAERLTRAVRAATQETAQEAVRLLQERVSTPYPPSSLPGESPHLRTGAGQEAIHVGESDTPDSVPIMLDESGKHMLYLELGTHTIAPRPWFRVTIAENRQHLDQHYARVFRREMSPNP